MARPISPTRRRVLASLSAGVLGTGALSACTPGGLRGRGRGRATTPPPSASERIAPTTPLILGSIGSTFGAPGQFDGQIALGIEEAVRRVNGLAGGVFAQDVVLETRVPVEAPGADVASQIEALASAGVSVLISSLEDSQLLEAVPAAVEHKMLVLCPWSSSAAVRENDASSGLLFRLAPDDTAMASLWVRTAMENAPEGTVPGTIAYVSPDTLQGRSLLAELSEQAAPLGGTMVLETFYPADEDLDVQALAAQIAGAPPALLILNGGAECGPLASAVHQATLDAGGRAQHTIPIRLGPNASVDYRDASLPPESLEQAEGFEPGGPVGVDVGDGLTFEDMMLNLDASLLGRGYAYSQQAFDAVLIACLAARHALSIEGTAIAASVPEVLSGTTECTDYGACDRLLRDAEEQGTTGSIRYTGASGPLELGGNRDVRAGQLRRITWSAAAERIVEADAISFEIAG